MLCGMNGLRVSRIQRLGAGIAAAALCLQFVLASWGALLLRADPVLTYGEHALCLAGEASAPHPAAPSDHAPGHAACDLNWCCFYHLVPGVHPLLAQVPQPVNFGSILLLSGAQRPFTPLQRLDLANARAPPLNS